MPQPVSTLTLGGTDISAYVSEDQASPIRWGRGASFDGSQESPGWGVFVVQNPDRRFNPLNSGSPIAAQLKFGKRVHLSAVHSSTTYHLFHGFLRHIFLRDDGFAEIHCQDALYDFARKETSIGAAWTRSIKDLRAAVMSDIGVAGTDLAGGNGGEAMVGYNAADQANVLDLLNDLNRATGTVHFIKPISGGYNYTTIDRLEFQDAASAEDWLDTDFTNPFAESLGASDYSDERIINSQRVKAKPREHQDTTTVWSRGRWTVNASSTEELWAEFDDPVTNLTISYTTIAGSPTVNVTGFGHTAKISVTAGGTAVDLQDIVLRGQKATEVATNSRRVEDATSISTYGRLEGALIESEYISSEAHAAGLASYIVWRNKDANLVPGPRFVNRFPTQLARDIGDVVRMTSAELSATLARFVIRGHENSISERGGRWETLYSLESLPAASTLFTLGGTADQGIGGTGILGR